MVIKNKQYINEYFKEFTISEDVNYIGFQAFKDDVIIKQRDKVIRCFCGVATICNADGTFNYFNGGKSVFVGFYNGIYAHGNTQEKANEMAKYWHDNKNVDKEYLAEDIKKRGRITILEFKLLTNLYCEFTDKIIESMSLEREFPLNVAIEMAKINTESNELMTKYFG